MFMFVLGFAIQTGKTQPEPKILGLGLVLDRDFKIAWILGSIL